MALNKIPESKSLTAFIQPLHARAGFTLIELVVASSILCVGIILIARSFLNASSALDSGQNRIKAIQILEARMFQIEQTAKEEKGVVKQELQEPAIVNNRSAVLRQAIEPVDIEELKDDLSIVRLSIEWQEAGINKDEVLVTYLKTKKEE